MTKETRKKLILIAVSIVVVLSVALGELYYIKSRFHYEDHLDETVITVDETEITLRQFGYYILEIEDFVQKQALLYDPEDPTHWWHTHFAAGLDSTFVSDYARKTAINTCICNEIYYKEALISGIKLDQNEEKAAKSKAEDIFGKMNDYQIAVTGLDNTIILDYTRKEMLATKYASLISENVDFTGYSGEPMRLLNWDGDYYLEEILPKHSILLNDSLLEKIKFGRITVNYD